MNSFSHKLHKNVHTPLLKGVPEGNALKYQIKKILMSGSSKGNEAQLSIVSRMINSSYETIGSEYQYTF